MPPDDHDLLALQGAFAAVAAAQGLVPVLERVAVAARRLARARYAAVGVPEDDGETFAHFVHVGMSEAKVRELGALPRRHGLLGALLAEQAPTRLADVAADPRFSWWPAAHPRMRSFLGVPVLYGGEVIAALYLADAEHRPGFDASDELLLATFAAGAATAIAGASVLERTRELSTAAERQRLGRDLHDALTQHLFSLRLVAEAATAEVAAGPAAGATPAATHALEAVQALAGAALDDLRALVRGLHPPAVAADGLAGAIDKHVELLRRARSVPIEVDLGQVTAEDRAVADDVAEAAFRIVQEALSNALRHAGASAVRVVVDLGSRPAAVTVQDDGHGFDPEAPRVVGRHLGLASMRERAAAVGASLEVDAAPGRGTTVHLVLPDRPARRG